MSLPPALGDAASDERLTVTALGVLVQLWALPNLPITARVVDLCRDQKGSTLGCVRRALRLLEQTGYLVRSRRRYDTADDNVPLMVWTLPGREWQLTGGSHLAAQTTVNRRATA